MSDDNELRDKLGKLPAGHCDNDYHPDAPAVTMEDLTLEERAIVERVMRNYPTLTQEEAIKRLRAAGL